MAKLALIGTARATSEGGVEVVRGEGRAGLLVICEHAGNVFPPAFGNLGLGPETINSHAAYDPGAYTMARAVATAFDATLIAQHTSRLLYDCNRPPDAESAICAVSEVHNIPGNTDLSVGERMDRVTSVYEPFRDAVAREVAHARAIVTIHTFTPVYRGERRDVEIGVVHDSDAHLADAFFQVAAGSGFDMRRNEPYGPADGVTHTLRTHATPAGLPNVMIEVRNDLVATEDAQQTMAGHLIRWLRQGLVALGASGGAAHA
ncbi:MAG: N-formylglutamate amidohydrolase [Pseudomonadota bacterium]